MVAKNLPDTNQKTEDRLASRWRTVAERYIYKWSELHIRVLLRDASKLCVVFNQAFMNEDFIDSADGQTGNPHSTHRAGNRKVKMSVFVNVMESVKPAENLVPIRVRSEAGLGLLDECYCLVVHPPEPTWAELFPGGWAVEQRESGRSGGSTAVDKDQLPCEMVKRGSEIVQAVPDDDVPVKRRCRRLPSDAPDLIAGIEVSLAGPTIRLAFSEVWEDILVAFEVFACPVYLRPDALQVVGEVGYTGAG